MKHFLPTFALLISSLFAPVAVSAQPFICNGPSGLVYVGLVATSCAAVNVGTFPAFTVGQCLVFQADLSLAGGACGGGGVSSVSNTDQLLVVSPTTGNAHVNLLKGTGSNCGASFVNRNGSFSSAQDGGWNIGNPLALSTDSIQGDGSGTVSVCAQTFNAGNSVVAANQFVTASGGQNSCQYLISVTNSTFTCLGSNQTFGQSLNGIACHDLLINSAITGGDRSCQAGMDASNNFTIGGGLYQTSPKITTGGAGGASISLGNVGAPAGACVSGSIYTRSDGTVASTMYVCEASAWVASAV